MRFVSVSWPRGWPPGWVRWIGLILLTAGLVWISLKTR